MKTIVRLLILLLAAGLALMSCSGSNGTATGPTKITIMVGFGTGGDPAQVELHEALMKEFNDSHKDIQIEFLTVPYADHVTKFTTMLASDSAPDIVMPIGVMGVGEFYDQWLDIAPFLKKDNYDTSDFFGPALEAHASKDRTVGLPFGVFPSVVYYNADLFDKAGLPYPPKTYGNPDWTYDKLLAVSKELTTDKNGKRASEKGFDPEAIEQYGFGGWEGSGFRGVVGKFGGNMSGFTEDFKTALMNDAGWKASLQYMADLVSKYHVSPKFASTASGTFTAGDPLGTNKVGMWECFSWAAYLYENWTNNFNWNVAAIPMGPTGQIVAQANSDTFAITKTSKHPEEAWEVMKWMFQAENLSRLAKSYGCIPSRKSLADGWVSDMRAKYPKVDWEVFVESINYLERPNHEAWAPNFRFVWDEMTKAMDAVCSGQSRDGSAVAEELNAKVQGYIDEYWKNQTK